MTIRLIDAAEGECDDSVVPTFFPCEMEEGWGYLYRGMQLWDLVNHERAETLKRLLHEGQQEDDSGRIVLPPGLMSQLVEVLQGLEAALLPITDEHHRLRPETVESVMAQAPYLVDSWMEGGRTVYTLENTLHDATRARQWLEQAIRLGREVEVD